MIAYPFAIFAISSRTKTDGDIFVFIEITNYAAMYLFTVAVFCRIAIYAKTHIDYINSGFSITEKCKSLCNDNREVPLILPLVIRVIYLYFGYTTLNVITLMQNSENLTSVPLIYKFTYFVPDLVMANTMIRFHMTIVLQQLCCKRINQALSECMEMMKNSSIKSTLKNPQIQIYVKKKFDKIIECHSILYGVTRGTEVLAGSVLIFYILKAFAHLSSMVN